MSSAFDLFCQTLPLEPQVYTFVVRPYVQGDEVSFVLFILLRILKNTANSDEVQ